MKLAVNNITDAQTNGRDRGGSVPINYQPFVTDLIGRSFSLRVRKVLSKRQG